MSFYRLLLCSMPLLLTACGDGWEAQRTTEIFPYGNQRTAGSGVVYVRAKMMPEKELVVETPAPTPEPAPAPALSGDKIFNESQMKGSHASAPVRTSAAPAPAHAAVEKPDQVVVAPAPVEQAAPAAANAAVAPSTGVPAAATATPGAAAVATPVPPPPAVAITPAAPAAVKEEIKQQVKEETHGSATDVISSPKQDKIRSKMAGASLSLNSDSMSKGQKHPQEQEVAVSTLRDATSESDAKKAAAVMPAAGEAYEVYPNEVIAPTHSVSMPKNEIVSPKKDYVHGSGEGRRSLDQIYEDSF